MTKHIIRWTAYLSDPKKPFIGFSKYKIFAATREEAREFDSYKMAVDFIKVYIRKGRFKGHDWQSFCAVEKADAPMTGENTS